MKELGQLIRAARKQKGVTLEQASAETRSKRQYLDAIEDGDLRIIPGTAYTTGFLRNYATYLGLNPDEVLQTYHAVSPPEVVSIEPATTVGAERLRRRSRRRITWVFATVLVVILGAALINRYNAQQHTAGSGYRPPVSTTSGFTPSSLSHHPGVNGDAAPHSHAVVHKQAMIRVRAMRTVWIHVVVNGRQVYWGPISANTHREWKGRKVKVSSHRGNELRVHVDGTHLGLMSQASGRVAIVAKPHTWHRLP